MNWKHYRKNRRRRKNTRKQHKREEQARQKLLEQYPVPDTELWLTEFIAHHLSLSGIGYRYSIKPDYLCETLTIGNGDVEVLVFASDDEEESDIEIGDHVVFINHSGRQYQVSTYDGFEDFWQRLRRCGVPIPRHLWS
jgi:hypothetical protein